MQAALPRRILPLPEGRLICTCRVELLTNAGCTEASQLATWATPCLQGWQSLQEGSGSAPSINTGMSKSQDMHAIE